MISIKTFKNRVSMAVRINITMYTTPYLLQHLARSNQTTHGGLLKDPTHKKQKANTANKVSSLPTKLYNSMPDTP
jgi:hypothetical protein